MPAMRGGQFSTREARLEWVDEVMRCRQEAEHQQTGAADEAEDSAGTQAAEGKQERTDDECREQYLRGTQQRPE